MKSIWAGVIGFGLVNIPVKLYGAINDHEINLDMLDKRDLARIRFVRVNEASGEEVAWENIVKGYKLKDKYVILNDEDFEKAAKEKSKTITLSEFVGTDEIDGIYYETPYYVEPDKTGEQAYALLREALLKTGKAGVVKFVMRNRENLGVLRAVDDVIVLNKLRFPEELRDVVGLSLPSRTELKRNELQTAVALINQLTTTFDITAHKDTYTAALLRLIKAKSKGVKTKAAPAKSLAPKSPDLMAQLKASLNNIKQIPS